MKKRTGKMISLSLAVAMAMTAAPVTALADENTQSNVIEASELTPAQSAGETGTDTTTVDTKEEEGTAWAELTPATTLEETPENEAKAGEVDSVKALKDAIVKAEDHDIITISEDLSINETIIVDKPVTITANAGVKLTVTGSDNTFKLSNGAKLEGLVIEKTDDANADIVYIVSDATVKNCKFSGTYDNTTNNSQTTRATITQAGATNFVIENNEIRNLRQPGYIEGKGQIIENTVENTRGWVVCGNYEPEIKDNIFNNNALDIAIIDNNSAVNENTTNFKNTIDVLSKDNNGAHVQQQVLKASAEDGVYFVEEGNANATMDGALKDASDGDTIKLKTDITVNSDGDQNNDAGVEIQKSIILDGDGHTISAGTFVNKNSLIGITNTKNVTIKNVTLVSEGVTNAYNALNAFGSDNVVIEGVTVNGGRGAGLVVNSSDVTVKDTTISDRLAAIDVEPRNTKDSTLTVESGTFDGMVVFTSNEKQKVDVTIEGGTFNSLVTSSSKNNDTFNISGGTFNSLTSLNGQSVNVTGGTFNNGLSTNTNTLTINGGTFNGDVTNNKEDATNNITGGDFKGKYPTDSIPNYMEMKDGKLVVKTDAGCLEEAIKKANNGDTIHLQAGTYTLADDVCMTLNKKLTISGEGSGTIVKGSSSTAYGNGLFTFTAGSEGSVLENMTIKYTATGAQTSAVYFDGKFAGTKANPTTIRNVDFKGADSLETIGTEMAITSTYLPTDKGSLKISGCNFKNFGYAMYFNNISNLTVEDCVIDGTKYNAINIAADNDNYKSNNITLTGNTLTNISYRGYEDEAYSSGIRLGKNISDDPVVTDNKITMLNNKKPILVEESTPGTAKYVALYKDGNTVIGQEIVDNAESITLPAAPSKTGYNFDGWYDGKKTWKAGESVTISEDTTFTAQWSKKSSGGSHRYDGYITIINPKNGEVSVSDNWADEDDKITLTITPDKGYVVDKIEIVDAEGDKIDAKKVEDKDDKYTFRMANCDVTVTVTFKEEGKTTEDTDKEEDKDDETTETTKLNFTDVKESDWFFKGVEYVVDKGIMSGVSENEFAPSGKLTRAMLVQMLYNMESRPACDAENAFIDVPVGQWYTDAVIWANDAKIVSGIGEGLFAPNMEITREQMVAMLYNYAKYKGYDVTASADLSTFADNASVSAWAQPAMQWAVAEGYISGMGDNQLAPQGTATRAEIASVIMRFMEATAETAE